MPQYKHPEVLATTEWLAGHLDDPSVRIVDMRHYVRAVSGGSRLCRSRGLPAGPHYGGSVCGFLIRPDRAGGPPTQHPVARPLRGPDWTSGDRQ